MTIYPTAWILSTGMDLAWHLADEVEAGVEDMDGALTSGDLATAFESARYTLNAVALAWQRVDGTPLSTVEPEFLAALGHARSRALATYASWPAVSELTEERMGELVAEVRGQVAELRAAVPFELPNLRSPDGLMPGLRAARLIDGLRARHGLPPFSWPGLMT